ncbi:Quinone oxidoreductase 2 [compost metagenome]
MATFQSVLQGGPWVIATGEEKIGWASRRDFAEAAAHVLTGEGHENTVYELSGPLLTQEELADIFAEAMNREVQVQYVDLEAYSKMLSSTGMPEAFVGFLVSIQKGISEGELNIESDDFHKVLGHPTTPLKTAFQQLLS